MRELICGCKYCRLDRAAPDMISLLKEIDAAWPVATSALRERVREVIAEVEPANGGQSSDG